MPRATTTFNPDDFTEQELQLISEALSEYIVLREESGESCQECYSVGEDDDGNAVHSADCRVAIAIGLRAKLGIEIETD